MEDFVDTKRIELKRSNKRFGLAAEIIFALIILAVLAYLAMPRFGGNGDPEVRRRKACYSNMRVLLGAVEMYNMDSSVMLKKLSASDYDYSGGILVKEGYLKKSPKYPTKECEYFSAGDLTGNGLIVCKKHGTVEHLDEKTQEKLGLIKKSRFSKWFDSLFD
jgi:hypothetical protein